MGKVDAARIGARSSMSKRMSPGARRSARNFPAQREIFPPWLPTQPTVGSTCASVEAQRTYLDRGAGTDALSVSGSLLVNLLGARERIVPYAAVGGGIYRTSLDLANPALFGPIGAQFGPGSVVCPAPGTGVGPGPGAGFGASTGTRVRQRQPAIWAWVRGRVSMPGGWVRWASLLAVPGKPAASWIPR